jgi:UDP-N-acetylmuramoyl-L-alanyl-D-glutamate--2,6-diaminopimelate ligase
MIKSIVPQTLKNVYHLFQSFLFNIFYGFPAKKLTIIGVTGTDGKTTTTSMIYHILKENGMKVGKITSLEADLDGELIDIGLHVTTPEPWDLPKILARAVQKGITHIVLESTSSGLDQNRLFGVTFDSCTITNIGYDHIEYHKTWKNYARAKFRIIEKTKSGGMVVLNRDHKKSAQWLEEKSKSFEHSRAISWYSRSELSNVEASTSGIAFDYQDIHFHIPIIGDYNLSNALGVIKLCNGFLSLEQIAQAFTTFETPLGRMQIMHTGGENLPTIIVDFAHTPSSLESALGALNRIKEKGSRIISVFGCAGERDPKRREMGRVSAELADFTIITIEDPRSENLKKINDEIIEYAQQGGVEIIERYTNHEEFSTPTDRSSRPSPPTVGGEKKRGYSFDYPTVQNRKDAISLALSLAKKDDIVFITGKGHEKSLALGSPAVEHPYSDQEVVEELIN